jgi:acetyl esterase/lipase
MADGTVGPVTRTPPMVTYSYGESPECVADLRVPAAAPRACVVLLHGGYWRDRYRRDLMEPLAESLAADGIATWNVEYRRVGSGGGVPRTIDDVAAAIEYLAQLAQQRDVGLGPVILVGHSAGAHLALCAAGRHRRRGSPSVGAAAVVALGGLCDLERAAREGLSNRAAVDFAGGEPDHWPLLYAEASPPRLLPLGVPYLLLHGMADDSVPWQLSADFHQRAIEAGDHGDLLLLEEVGHLEPIDPATPAGQRVLAWIDELLEQG